MSVVAGDRLGPYEILSRIGEGGMGEVWRAKDTRLNRIVAIKLLRGEQTNQPDFHARFEREAKAISSFNHPTHLHSPRLRHSERSAISRAGVPGRRDLGREATPRADAA